MSETVGEVGVIRCACCGSVDITRLEQVGSRSGKYGESFGELVVDDEGVGARRSGGGRVEPRMCLRCRHVMLFLAE